MKVSVEEARRIVWEDSSDFEMIETNIEDTSRWSIHYTGICKHIETGKFYEISWSQGATESQDEGPFEYISGDINLVEVEQQEVVVKQWVQVKS